MTIIASTGMYIGLGIAGGLLLILIFASIGIYNSLTRKKLSIENSFSQISIQCKKRFDLVPNLVEVVKAYAKHEKDTLESVVEARNAGMSANGATELASANNRLSATLGRLFALSEAYPELKANTNFGMLQSQLIELEKAIAISRSFYNDSVMIYNRSCLVFPNNIFASLFRFKKAEFFSSTDEERQNVTVNLQN